MKPALLAAAALLTVATPATAQLVVHDPTSYASLIKQAQTALDQLNELKTQVTDGKRLFASLNDASSAGQLAQGLANPQLRAFVPKIDGYVAAANGDLAALGRIGGQAATIRQGARLYTDALNPDLEQAGDRAARDVALGREAARVGGERLAGLQQLSEALDTAPNARAVLDLQARLSAEQAMIANDQMQLQGLAMAQAAEDRLQAQRDRERAMAAAQARRQHYRRGFQ
jgi:type IV secretion system protein VirB5